MVDERDSGVPLKGTFLVWSWIGLLVGYVYTTVSLGSLSLAMGLAGRLPSVPGRGRDVDPALRLLSVVGVIAPIVILALAYVVFLRYSVATYRAAVLEPPREGDGQELLALFRGSLAWLIAVWIVVLSLRALVLVLSPSFVG
jgi:hypothetical protein